MNLEVIGLNKISPSQKDKHNNGLTYIWNLKGQVTEAESRMGLLGTGVGENREIPA